MAEHMRISMLNPDWLKQKQKEKKEREEQEEVLATGSNIEANLKRMAEYRSDMFGSGAEETIIGRKKGAHEQVEKEKTAETAAWDGHNNTAETASKRAINGISLEDQIKAIHQSQGLVEASDQQQQAASGGFEATIVPKPLQPPVMPLAAQTHIIAQPPPPPPPPPSSMILPPRPIPIPPVNIPAPPPPAVAIPGEMRALPAEIEEPASKRQKTEEQLMPESEFLAQHADKGPVTFTVQVPSVGDKPEWNLNGQTLQITLPLTETIATIKNKLAEILSMPNAKQKLQLDVSLLR